MKSLLLGMVLACAPVAAAALSCMPHSVELAFGQAQAAEERFVVVQGRLGFNARKLPKVDYDNQLSTPAMTLIKGELRGVSLSAAGFKTPYRSKVTLAVACYGPWCASAKAGAEVLAFVELGTDGNVISTDPCGGYLFTEPTKKMIRAVEQCYAGGSCAPTKLR